MFSSRKLSYNKFTRNWTNFWIKFINYGRLEFKKNTALSKKVKCLVKLSFTKVDHKCQTRNSIRAHIKLRYISETKNLCFLKDNYKIITI